MHNLPYYICGLLIVILFYWVLLKNDQFEGVSVKENDTDIFLVMRHFINNFNPQAPVAQKNCRGGGFSTFLR